MAKKPRLSHLFQRTIEGGPIIKKRVRCVEGQKTPECRCLFKTAKGWCGGYTYNGRQPRINPETGRCELYNKVNRHPKITITEVGR